jgi:histone H3/H4
MMGAQEAYNSTANDDFDNDATTDRDFEMGERDDEELTVTTGASGGGSGTGALFPLARIKKIMKADKDVNLVAADAVNLVSLATELFVDSLVKKASDISQNEKRRTILYKDFGRPIRFLSLL